MALRNLNFRKIKRTLVVAIVVITVTLLYLRNVVIIHGFTRAGEVPTEELVRKRENTQTYQKNTSCPVLSLQSQHNDNMDTKYSDKCKPWKQAEDICGIANNFYSINKDIYCRGKAKNTSRNICSFVFRNQVVDKTPEINCDNEICRNGSLIVGSVNPGIGAVTSQDWKEFRSAKSAELALPGIISDNVKNGFSFCLIRCVKNDENIDQLLTFQHIFTTYRDKLRDKQSQMGIRVKRKRRQKQRGKESNLFNINILMLDSVSRNHFYRMLNKTVNTLRQAALGPDVHVLDYEFLQSLAPYTYKNIKALFTGTIEREAHNNLNQNIGINSLYGHFKRHGYRTLFQEDSCWYDRWGTILENSIRKDKLPQSVEDFKKSWGHFRNLTKTYSIDDYGLTHFSCVVFKMHGITNMFNKPLKVCYDGQPISPYFLRYAQEFLNQANARKSKGPTFSYLHTNFGHEETGLRITAIDDALSEFVRDMSKQKDTLTIILSDHGPKTTVYSQDYLHGRYETYDSLSFMILPKKVQHGLGESRMAALVKNQKSLITMQDIHAMLTEMTQFHKRKSALFSDLSKRTCDSIQMINYGVCKCRDWERLFIDQSPRFIQLAEFSTELLNDKIHEQFSTSNRSGFGKCRKLQLHRIWNIRQRISNASYITTFDLVVQPFYTVFLVQTKHTEKNGIVDNVTLQSWRRVSLYRHYIKCKDKSVDIELCVCNLRKRNSNKRLLEIIEDAKGSKDNEIIKTRTSCLYILLSKVEDKLESIFSYDVINTCAIRYIFTVDSLKNVENLQGRKIIKEIQPNTDTFLFSVVAKEKRNPKFKYYFKRTY